MNRLVQFHVPNQSLAFTTDNLSGMWLNVEKQEIQIATTNWIYTLTAESQSEVCEWYDVLTGCILRDYSDRPEIVKNIRAGQRSFRFVSPEKV